MDEIKKTVFLPWRGEFGQMIMAHVRWVHQHPAATKVVCCRRGDEALFPSAVDYFYDWADMPDEMKCTKSLDDHGNLQYLEWVQDRVRQKFADQDLEFVQPLDGGKPQRYKADPAKDFKPRPQTIACFPPIDVLVCPRFRKHGQHRNYQHWEAVVKGLQANGLTVALAGMKQTSVDVRSVPEHLKSWNYDSLDSTLHMMNVARVVLATDAGLAHLAVLNQSPLLVIYDQPGVEAGKPEWPWVLPHMQRHATVDCNPIINGWNNSQVVVDSVVSYLGVEDEGLRLSPVVQVSDTGPVPGRRQNLLICSMVYQYQKRYWWQLSSLLQQVEWASNLVPNITSLADITARDMNYGWNNDLLNKFNGFGQNADGRKFNHVQRKWPIVEPETEDQYGQRGHIRSANIRQALDEGWADWILFNDADMVYGPEFFSQLMTMVDPDETRVYAAPRWTMKFEDGYRLIDSVKYSQPIEDPVDKLLAIVTEPIWQSARGRISGAGFFQLVSLKGLRKKVEEDPGFVDYVPPGYNHDHNTLDDDQTHITRSDKKFRDRLGGIVPLAEADGQYHINHFRRDHVDYDPGLLH